VIPTTCAVCETDKADREVYPDTLGDNAATRERFSARRTPDRVHYRMVRCGKCGLLRSNPILTDEELSNLYRESALTYGEEAAFARRTYGRYLQECLSRLPPGADPQDARLLEIGCGHGFFLEQAIRCGFAEVRGVEPSREAVALAPDSVRGFIVNDIFREGLFPTGYFDVVCAFQVFDHLAHPNEILKACLKVLRPGGLALFINHDVGAWTNRLLGARSPVIDVEHIYLFDTDTMARIFRKNGFEVLDVFPVANSYPLYYWMKMAPWPESWKRRLIPALKATGLGRTELSWKAGNLGLVARNPGISGAN
jgi:SAM-dependent methyltransferase